MKTFLIRVLIVPRLFFGFISFLKANGVGAMYLRLFIRINFIRAFLLFIGMTSFTNSYGQQQGEYKVWMKTSPCSGRYDWISVAKENPTPYGLSFHSLAGTTCDNGCTFEEAMRVADTRRLANDFYNYCCRDYSVWYKTLQDGTRAYTIILGRFFTGEGYFFLQGDLCCEEAEALAGIPGACSGRAPITCPAGSYSAWNPQTKQSECFCYPGYMWNNTKTSCISFAPDCEKSYPNSVAIWDNATSRYLCNCKQGFVWNDTKTACVPAIPDCNAYYKNSVAVWDDAKKQYLCNCPQGYVWNTSKTECIFNIPDCNAYYKNSVAVWDGATKQYLCNCPQGYVWNATRTECILAIPDCNAFYKNSVAVWDDATKQYLCNCPQGYVWNATRTECILAIPDCNAFYKNSYASWDVTTNQYLCYCNPGYEWNALKTECILSGNVGTQTSVVYYAKPGYNSLAGNYPTRGFGDSDKIDTWIPFDFTFTAPATEIISAKIKARMKPIGDLIGTDGLGIMGSDGKTYWLSLDFKTTKPEFQDIEFTITEPQVLSEIKKGKLICVLQDDSAVSDVRLIISLR